MWWMVWVLLLVASAVLAVLKLAGNIDWSWWWVAAPALVAFAPLTVVGFIIYFSVTRKQDD